MTDSTLDPAIDPSATLGAVVMDNPGAAGVLESFGLDFCCRGDRTLADACQAAGVDPQDVIATLADAGVGADGAGGDAWSGLDAPALADHIVEAHHRYLHEELPLLDALAEKVAGVHAERHSELHDVRRLVAALRADFEPHLAKEERILFPAIHALALGHRSFPFGSIENPIRVMTLEHETTGTILADLRRASGGYRVPEDACASYRSLYERLAALEFDTHLHIHKENHALFPRAIALFAA